MHLKSITAGGHITKISEKYIGYLKAVKNMRMIIGHYRQEKEQIMKEIHWAVLGTGVIANEMASALQKNGKRLYAVGNRTYEKAVAFAKKYGVEKVYNDYNEMFTDPEVDVIYITTPHNTHINFMKKRSKTANMYW